ncbi:optic atrophy 3 domain-containing protein [Trichoderma ceciliae]
MVPLPLFKLAALFVRHVSKYGANRIKLRAHDHPRFRALAARYGQAIHQLNMKLSVALLRDPEAERRAREMAEAPTVKTEEQYKRDVEASQKAKKKNEPEPASYSKFTLQSVWKRKFRPLPEGKAVDLFADVAGDTFILGVAGTLIVYEYWKASQKPDVNKERIDELDRRFEELQRKEGELADAEERQRQRYESLEEALRALKDPKTKQPLLPRPCFCFFYFFYIENSAKEQFAAMFCSSLRQRKDWAPVVPALSRSTSSGWKGGLFKLVLLTSGEAKTAEAESRVERLAMLDGGRNVAIILLLGKGGRVDSLVDLQMSTIVTHGMVHVPIIPISSAMELVVRLDALRRQCTASVPRRGYAEEMAEIRGLASHCVHGQALSHGQVDILTDISTGLGSLAQLVLSAEGQRKICDLLGDVEGKRVISFFVNGHETNRRLEIWTREQGPGNEQTRSAEF